MLKYFFSSHRSTELVVVPPKHQYTARQKGPQWPDLATCAPHALPCHVPCLHFSDLFRSGLLVHVVVAPVSCAGEYQTSDNVAHRFSWPESHHARFGLNAIGGSFTAQSEGRSPAFCAVMAGSHPAAGFGSSESENVSLTNGFHNETVLPRFARGIQIAVLATLRIPLRCGLSLKATRR